MPIVVADTLGKWGEELFPIRRRLGAEEGRWEQKPHHQLIIEREGDELLWSVECPFELIDPDDNVFRRDSRTLPHEMVHTDVNYCTMIELYPALMWRTEGAMLAMDWRALAGCYVIYEASQAGVEYLLEMGGHGSPDFPEWAKRPGKVDVVLNSYGSGEDYTTWLDLPADVAQ